VKVYSTFTPVLAEVSMKIISLLFANLSPSSKEISLLRNYFTN